MCKSIYKFKQFFKCKKCIHINQLKNSDMVFCLDIPIFFILVRCKISLMPRIVVMGVSMSSDC